MSVPVAERAAPLPHSAEFNHYWAYVSFGIFFFVVLNGFTSRFFVPKSASNNRKQRWKWANIFTSLVHSTITGIVAPIAFYLDPKLSTDLIYAYNDTIHVLLSFSIGYFIYDFLDMFLYNPKKSTYELLFHHVCVITCFGIAAHTQHYLPYATLALIVEINSIFLHLRQLFIIQGVSKQSLAYRTIALLNVGTFVVFRVVLMGWMTRWLTVNREHLPILMFSAGSVGLTVVMTMNAVLFYRILNSDFFAKSSNKVKCESNILNEGFHPVSKDVNRIMKSLFDGEEITEETKGNTAKKND